MSRITVIQTDGTEFDVITSKRGRALIDTCKGYIHAKTLDTVNLKDGRVILVDDLGHEQKKPVNRTATKMYRRVCFSGTTHQIVGDVAIALDEDFA